MIKFLGKSLLLYLVSALVFGACNTSEVSNASKIQTEDADVLITLDLDEARRLAALPFECINQPLPYKSGHVLADSQDLKMPVEHHPAFYGCFDWHSAVHGHWSLVYLMKKFPDLDSSGDIRAKLRNNLTAENILTEIEYFNRNSYTKSFERTYGWAWLLKLQEELLDWDDPDARNWASNLAPLASHIAQAYIEYLPKLVYPIRVGEHSNTAFGLSFAYDYARAVQDSSLIDIIDESALRFYSEDSVCPISWEPSGYDFLSPCLQEMDIMRKVLDQEKFNKWLDAFLPGIKMNNLDMEPARIIDRTDGKLVHLDGLNFSRAWCLYGIENAYARKIADQHMSYSLKNIVDGDYAGQHWLASFALYAYKCKQQ